MYTCKLDMLHNRRYKCVSSIADRIRLTLQCMIQETVNQDWTVRCYTNCCLHVVSHCHIIVDYFHSTSAKYVRWANHNRITDLACDLYCLFYGCSHSRFRHRNLQLIHHCTELISVLCKIDNRRCGSKNTNAILLQICCQIQRCLSTELCNHAKWFFLFVNAQHVFQCQRLEVQLVRSIIVCRNRLRITVHDNRLKSKLLQRHCRMYTTIIKLNTLTDTVRSTAKDHNLTVIRYRIGILCIICRVVICTVLRTAYMYTFPRLYDTKLFSLIADISFRNFQDLAEVFVRESVFLSLCQRFV